MQTKVKRKNGWGGKRPGAGRKKGSGTGLNPKIYMRVPMTIKPVVVAFIKKLKELEKWTSKNSG